MKKNLAKKISCVALCLTSCLSMFACGGGAGSNSNDVDLTITYYKGGYGSEWLESAVSKYQEENGVKISLKPSTKLNCDVTTNIKSGRNLSDIYICADSEWISFVANGYLADLSDVYNTEVSTSSGKVKIKDYIDQDIVDKYYMQRKAGTGENLPWVMPWSAQPGAFAYNEDLLKKVVHHSSNGEVENLNDGNKWTNPPKTYDELIAYCKDVNMYESDDGYTYVPFGWSGIAPDMFYYVIYAWWAELQGTEQSLIANEGSFFDFWNFGNEGSVGNQTFDTNVFMQTGIQTAIDKLINLIVADGQFVNSLSDATKLTAQQLQRTFVAMSESSKGTEKPAIVLASSYLEYETKLNGYLDSNKDGKQDVNFKFMNVPKLNKSSNDKVYCLYEDVMFIPSASTHIDQAKKFLSYICQESYLKEFSQITGGIRPFNYNPTNLSGLSDYTKSVYDVYFNSERVFEYPKTALSPENVSCIYRYERPTLFGNVTLSTVLNNFKSKNGLQIMTDAKESIENLSEQNWLKKYRGFFGE